LILEEVKSTQTEVVLTQMEVVEEASTGKGLVGKVLLKGVVVYS